MSAFRFSCVNDRLLSQRIKILMQAASLSVSTIYIPSFRERVAVSLEKCEHAHNL